jgi:hemoglobin-like flavoprotein
MKFSTHPLSPDLASRRDLHAAPIDMELVARLRNSFNSMLGHGEALADVFYADLFAKYPELRALFQSADMRALKKKLLQTLEWVMLNLDRPVDVRVAARELGKKHEGFGVKPEFYPIVRDTLVGAMGKVSGQEWTRELEADWRLSIDLLSALMTGKSAIRRGEKTGTRA